MREMILSSLNIWFWVPIDLTDAKKQHYYIKCLILKDNFCSNSIFPGV